MYKHTFHYFLGNKKVPWNLYFIDKNIYFSVFLLNIYRSCLLGSFRPLTVLPKCTWGPDKVGKVVFKEKAKLFYLSFNVYTIQPHVPFISSKYPQISFMIQLKNIGLFSPGAFYNSVSQVFIHINQFSPQYPKALPG